MRVITIMSDEHSNHAMHFIDGNILKTPNLDRLASEGCVFTNGYSTCPVCAPARGSFFSGKYVNRIGTWDNATPYDGKVLGLTEHLNQYGIKTAWIGKSHFHPDGEYGFEYSNYEGYMGHSDLGCYFRDEKLGRLNAKKRFEKIGIRTEDSKDDYVLKDTLKWLNENYQREDFMLYVGFLDPHFPFYVKQGNWDYFNEKISELPEELKPPFASVNEPLSWMRKYFECEEVDEEIVRKALVGYYCMVAELDERIGTILDEVDRLGIADDTAIIYTSDHGEQLGYHGMWWKCTMFEESANVPMIVKVPGQKARTIEHPVSLVDVFPTICDLYNLTKPENIDGESMMTLVMEGKDEDKQDFAFSEYHAHGMPVGMYMIRWQDFKYVYYCYHEPQLFNLKDDPKEDHDLFEESKNNQELKMVIDQCHKRLLSICSPYEVDTRAKTYQNKMKRAQGLTSYDREWSDLVPHPEAFKG